MNRRDRLSRFSECLYLARRLLPGQVPVHRPALLSGLELGDGDRRGAVGRGAVLRPGWGMGVVEAAG